MTPEQRAFEAVKACRGAKGTFCLGTMCCTKHAAAAIREAVKEERKASDKAWQESWYVQAWCDDFAADARKAAFAEWYAKGWMQHTYQCDAEHEDFVQGLSDWDCCCGLSDLRAERSASPQIETKGDRRERKQP